MQKYINFSLLVVVLCSYQLAIASSDQFKTYDLTNDVLLNVPATITKNSALETANFNVLDVQANLLRQEDQVYPIQFDQTIDVLVIHSPQLPEIAIQREIDHMKDLFDGLGIANESLENSGVTGTYRIIDIVEQSFFEDKLTQAFSNAPDVVLAQNGNNATQYLYQKSGADFILSIANTPRVLAGVSSTANVLGTSEDELNKLLVSYPLLGNSGITQESLGGTIIAHEFGHTLGLRHDRESFSNSDFVVDSFIAYGFTDPQKRYSSIMSATGCRPQNCKQAFYSSPDIFINGIQMGVDESQANAADAAKAVRTTFQYAAYFNSRFQSANTVWEETPEGILLDWPDVIGADYYLLIPRSCTYFDSGFFTDQLDGAIQVNHSSALIQNLQNDVDVCIVAEKDASDRQEVSRMLLGGTQIFVSEEHIKLNASLLRLESNLSNLILDFQLSDPSVENASLALSLFYFAQANINENWFDMDDFEAPQMKSVLDSIIDYSFTGEGSTRQLNMNLKVPFTQISAAYANVVELPQFVAPLRLRIGYINESGLPISSHFAINDSLPNTNKPTLLGFPKRIESQTSTELNFAIENAPVGASISLIPDNGLIIEDESFEFIRLGNRNRTHIKAIVKTESSLQETFSVGVMLEGIELNEKVNITSGPINELPAIQLSLDSNLIAGTDVQIRGNSSDSDGFIEQYRWSIISGPSFPDTVFNQENLLIPNAQSGDFQVDLKVVDDKGSIAQQSISFTVQENTSSPSPTLPDTQEDSSGGSFNIFTMIIVFLITAIRVNGHLVLRNTRTYCLRQHLLTRQTLPK